MSVQALSWAFKQQIVRDAPARLVLLSLANYCGADGEDAFPSVSTIQRDTGLSERTIRDRLSKLLESGLIEIGNQAIVEVKGYRANRMPTVYNLRLDRVTPEDTDPNLNEVQDMHPKNNLGVQEIPSRGAGDVSLGCSSRRSGVQELHPNHYITNNKPLDKPIDVRSQENAPVQSEEIEHDHFEDFWLAWPRYRRVNKKGARVSFERAVKRAGGVEPIAEGLNRSLSVWPKDDRDERCRLVPHPTTWLNQDRFNDPVESTGINFSGNGNSRGHNAYKPMPRDAFCNLDDPIGEP